jgi:hypothetical protein
MYATPDPDFLKIVLKSVLTNPEVLSFGEDIRGPEVVLLDQPRLVNIVTIFFYWARTKVF